MPKARIIKIISNQYTIQDGQRISVAAVRGKQRLKFKPAVGDLVEYEDKDDQTIIMNVLPRMNHLLRPFVANVDQALIVTSMKDPDYSEHLLNRLIFLSLLANIRPRIVVTKSDMMDEESRKKIEEDLRWYEKQDTMFSILIRAAMMNYSKKFSRIRSAFFADNPELANHLCSIAWIQIFICGLRKFLKHSDAEDIRQDIVNCIQWLVV